MSTILEKKKRGLFSEKIFAKIRKRGTIFGQMATIYPISHHTDSEEEEETWIWIDISDIIKDFHNCNNI